MPLYSLLRMIQSVFVLKLDDETPYLDLLIQNKYYFVPIVNVDTVAEIEKQFL
jgi:hypothetical protein